MASGYPDYLGWAGRTGVGTAVYDESYAGEINAESTGYVDLDIVPAGFEHMYQCVTVSCPDDSSVHSIALTIISTDETVFFANFVTGEVWDFPGVPIAAGLQVRVTISNFSGGALNFKGTTFHTVRPI